MRCRVGRRPPRANHSVEHPVELRWTAEGGGGDAAPWIHLIALSLILYVVLPRLLLAAVAGFGLCIIGFALSRHFWLSAALLMMSGMCDSVSVVVRSTILQLSTPDHMRGRVASINGIFIGSSNELGAFESGVAARVLGLVPSVIFGGSMTLAVVGITARLAPKLRRLNLGELR